MLRLDVREVNLPLSVRYVYSTESTLKRPFSHPKLVQMTSVKFTLYLIFVSALIAFLELYPRVVCVSYSFMYAVDEPNLGVVTQHWERRHGAHVRGGYSFLDANGKIRVVEYLVEGNKGYKAFVTFRRPPGQFMGHLHYPKEFRNPIRLAEPVGLITPDLFQMEEAYPNLPIK